MTERKMTAGSAIPSWTKPYLGVSHLNKTKGSSMYPLFTIVEYQFFVEAHVSTLGRVGYLRERLFRKTIEGKAIDQAKAWCEEQARELGALP